MAVHARQRPRAATRCGTSSWSTDLTAPPAFPVNGRGSSHRGDGAVIPSALRARAVPSPPASTRTGVSPLGCPRARVRRSVRPLLRVSVSVSVSTAPTAERTNIESRVLLRNLGEPGRNRPCSGEAEGRSRLADEFRASRFEPWREVVSPEGIEPSTNRLRVCCSAS